MKLVRIALLSAFTLIGFSTGTAASWAQAITTASKSAEISAFGAYMVSKTDYGPKSKKGLSLGADFTIFPRFPVSPSFEVRASEASALDATEKSVMAGIRIQRDIHRNLHPYVDFLIGVGEIVFHPAPDPDYTSDTSRAISYGGGINIDVARHFALKLDAQYQSWNFGLNNSAAPSEGTFLLNPVTIMGGVTYTIPFRILNRHSDFR